MKKCIVCGKEIEKSAYMNADLCGSECFHINFWNEIVDDKDNPNRVRVNGKAYYIGNEKDKSSFRGFGGARFHIKFLDGREVISTNLWHNGEIPEDFRDRLSDNAVFVKDDIEKFSESLLK